jgi:hypothetical protein
LIYRELARAFIAICCAVRNTVKLRALLLHAITDAEFSRRKGRCYGGFDTGIASKWLTHGRSSARGSMSPDSLHVAGSRGRLTLQALNVFMGDMQGNV